MILVAGLAIAGLAGIAAAFYFSIRPGSSGKERRLQAPGSGRPVAEADRSPGRPGLARSSPSRSGHTAGRSRPDPDDDFSGPSRRRPDAVHLAAGHRVHRGGSAGSRTEHTAPRTVPVGTRRAASAGSGPRRADRPDWEEGTTAAAAATRAQSQSQSQSHAQAQAQAQSQAEAGRSRRRVGWRKGSEVDEEMWPTESFGGVSDEQFWDDLASDKPLATTARTAAAPGVSGSRRRLPDVVPGRDGDDRSRGDGNRLGAQPLQSGPQPIQGGPQPISPATRSHQPGTQPQPYQAVQSYQPATQVSYQPATQPAPIAGQGGRAGLPAEPRGRGRMTNGTDVGAGAAAGEDPLTSAAYALRPPGAVDGRSYPSSRRPRDLSREQYEAALSQETQSFSLAEAQSATGGYPAGAPPFRQFDTPAGSGGGNGRGPEPRSDGVRSDPNRYDGLRSDPLRTDPLRSDPLRSDAYWSGGRADPPRGSAGTGDAYGSTAGHPYPERPYSDPPQSATTPPYSGYGYPVSPADDPRQPNGTRGQGRSGGNGSWGARQASPTGNGYRGPYDPRTNGRG